MYDGHLRHVFHGALFLVAHKYYLANVLHFFVLSLPSYHEDWKQYSGPNELGYAGCVQYWKGGALISVLSPCLHR